MKKFLQLANCDRLEDVSTNQDLTPELRDWERQIHEVIKTHSRTRAYSRINELANRVSELEEQLVGARMESADTRTELLTLRARKQRVFPQSTENPRNQPLVDFASLYD